MLEFQEKKIFRNFIRSDIMLFVSFVLIVILLKSNWSVYKSEEETYANRQYALQRLEELKKRELIATSNIEKMNSDIGIEEEIRNKLGLAKKNEKVIVILNNPSEKEHNNIEDKRDWWSKFTNIFK